MSYKQSDIPQFKMSHNICYFTIKENISSYVKRLKGILMIKTRRDHTAKPNGPIRFFIIHYRVC